jgi:hypothetical protein
MAILKGSLEEPLLSREQAAVIRAIAHAAQLFEAEQVLYKMESETRKWKGLEPTVPDANPLNKYLKAERERVLTQVKIPASKVTSSVADTNVPK